MSAFRRLAPAEPTSRDVDDVPNSGIAHLTDFKVFFATSMKARSFGAREARRG
jgi:hypothetical protein